MGMTERRLSRGLTVRADDAEGLVYMDGPTTGNGMSHTHTAGSAANIYPLGTDGHNQVALGCFSWEEGEDVEPRWNEYAQKLWEAGLEPVNDEPAFSTTEGTTTFDHYVLVSIYR
jgi:hypothetical protein